MSKIALLFLLLTLSACSHPTKDFDEHLSQRRCDEALKHRPENEPLAKAQDNMSYIGKNLLAYSYVTASYTTQIVWDVAAGTVVVVAVNAPVILLAAALNANVNSISFPHATDSQAFPTQNNGPYGPSSSGFSEDPLYQALSSPPLGERALAQTEKFRCPNLKGVKESLFAVASCYEEKGDKASLAKATESLSNIEKSNSFFSCLSVEDQQAVSQYREKLEQQTREI